MDRTYFEIKRQYDTLDKTIRYFESHKESLRNFYLDRKPKTIIFVGSGSSYFVSQSGEIIARTEFGMNSFSIAAGDAMVNFNANKASFEGALAVAVSRSGSTTEILKTVAAMKNELGLPVVGIACVEGSELAKIADICLELPWAFDESVCQTGTVTNLYAALALLLASFADCSRTYEDIKRMTSIGDKFIEDNEDALKVISEKQWSSAVVLADGDVSGLAEEAALAFKEICCTHSNYYHVLDVRHGPMVLIDKNTLVVVDLKPENKQYQLDLVTDLAKKGATIVVLTDDSYDTIENAALHIKHPDVGNIAEGLPLVAAVQLIAYQKALIKGVDPGNPVGLDAWIKLN